MGKVFDVCEYGNIGCTYYIWRELCVYLCNHVVQRSWFQVAMFKVSVVVRWSLYLHGLHDRCVLTF